jgi:hypothetical protein
MAGSKRYPDELIQRGVRLALDGTGRSPTSRMTWGSHPETLRKRVRRAEADSGARPELLVAGARGDPPAAA